MRLAVHAALSPGYARHRARQHITGSSSGGGGGGGHGEKAEGEDGGEGGHAGEYVFAYLSEEVRWFAALRCHALYTPLPHQPLTLTTISPIPPSPRTRIYGMCTR